MAMVRAMTSFGLSIEIPKRDIQRMQDRFENQIPGAFARANKYVLDEIAKAAVTGFRKEAHKYIDRPKAWTLRGIRYRRAVYTADWSDQSSSIYVLDDQSAVLKYLMGETKRLPGDVGPSRNYIAVPRQRNMQKVGLKLDGYGNMPASTLTRLRREAGVSSTQMAPNPKSGRVGRAAARRHAEGTQLKITKKREDAGAFFGTPTIFGVKQPLGFYARPRRDLKEGKWVNRRAPLMLIYAATDTKHQPKLQRFWADNAALAADDYAQLMGQELRRKLEFLASRGS